MATTFLVGAGFHLSSCSAQHSHQCRISRVVGSQTGSLCGQDSSGYGGRGHGAPSQNFGVRLKVIRVRGRLKATEIGQTSELRGRFQRDGRVGYLSRGVLKTPLRLSSLTSGVAGSRLLFPSVSHSGLRGQLRRGLQVSVATGASKGSSLVEGTNERESDEQRIENGDAIEEGRQRERGDISALNENESDERIEQGDGGVVLMDRSTTQGRKLGFSFRDFTKESGAKLSRVKEKGEKAWTDLKQWHILYQEDIESWGVGTNPIFLVHENAEGIPVKVTIDEDEILRRSGIEPFFSQSVDTQNNTLVAERSSRAKVLAREIEVGIVRPSRASSIFKFAREGEPVIGPKEALYNIYGAIFNSRKDENDQRMGVKTTLGSVYSRVGAVVSNTPPAAKYSLLGFLVFYAICIVWGARIFMSEKKKTEARQEHDRELRLSRMRTMKEEIENGINPVLEEEDHKLTGEIAKPLVDDDEFRKRVVEIRTMAREARLAEQQSAEALAFSANTDIGPVRIAPSNGRLGKKNLDRPMPGQIRDEKPPKTTDREPSVDMEMQDLLLKELLPGKADDMGPDFHSDNLKVLAGQLDDIRRYGANHPGEGMATGLSNSDLAGVRNEGLNGVPLDPREGGLLGTEGLLAEAVDKAHTNEISSTAGDSTGLPIDGQAKAPINGRIKPPLKSEAIPATSGQASLIGEKKSSINGAANPPSKDSAKLTTNGSEIAVPNRKAKPPINGRVIPPVDGKVNPPISSLSPHGVKPRIIISPEEARARIAAKKAKEGVGLDGPSSGTGGSKASTGYFRLRKEVVSSQDEKPATGSNDAQSVLKADSGAKSQPLTELAEKESTEAIADVSPPQVTAYGADEALSSGETKGITRMEASESDEKKDFEHRQTEGPQGNNSEVKQGRLINEEQEEMEWMRDEVLRAIVFKVRDNEEAGRESFDGLNSEEEILFFKGLERKFEREGELVKTWIQERVENLDYGRDGISIFDPPEMYMAKWKGTEGLEGLAGDIKSQFDMDRKRIIQEQLGLSSPPPPSPSPPPAPSTSKSSPPPLSQPSRKKRGPSMERGRSNEFTSISGSKTTVTSSGRKANQEASWEHTKKWADDLQRKYDMEKDPAQRALMKEVGRNLDKWITQDEINEAERLLSQGVEGEKEYARLHYEKIKKKIREESETFGQKAMLNKYAEYKPTKQDELWWLDLPYILCIGLHTTVKGEAEDGLYSLDMTPDFGGIIEGKMKTKFHTVAFQDRKEAVNFCSLLRTQPDKMPVDGLQVVPFNPKDLYQDAKAEGFKVTVLKKGQLELKPGQPLEDVERRIIEIGSAVYWDELERDRLIDVDTVLDEGFGYGRRPS